jgi:hypothetical protein
MAMPGYYWADPYVHYCPEGRGKKALIFRISISGGMDSDLSGNLIFSP